jgi:uncharacterized membrane protein
MLLLHLQRYDEQISTICTLAEMLSSCLAAITGQAAIQQQQQQRRHSQRPAADIVKSTGDSRSTQQRRANWHTCAFSLHSAFCRKHLYGAGCPQALGAACQHLIAKPRSCYPCYHLLLLLLLLLLLPFGCLVCAGLLEVCGAS